MRLGRGFTAVARQVPRLAGLAGLKPCTPDCAAEPHRGVGRHAAWPGFYRRGTTGATARRSGVATCQLDRKDRHSTTGLMARIKRSAWIEDHAGFFCCKNIQAVLKYPKWCYWCMDSANRKKTNLFSCAAKPSQPHRSIPSAAI